MRFPLEPLPEQDFQRYSCFFMWNSIIFILMFFSFFIPNKVYVKCLLIMNVLKSIYLFFVSHIYFLFFMAFLLQVAETGVTGTFRSETLNEWLQKHNPSQLEFKRAVSNFTSNILIYLFIPSYSSRELFLTLPSHVFIH